MSDPMIHLSHHTTMAADIKRALVHQMRTVMDRNNVSQAELARRMSTSRAVIRRLLDDDDLSVTLTTISKAAAALEKTLYIQLKNN